MSVFDETNDFAEELAEIAEELKTELELAALMRELDDMIDRLERLNMDDVKLIPEHLWWLYTKTQALCDQYEDVEFRKVLCRRPTGCLDVIFLIQEQVMFKREELRRQRERRGRREATSGGDGT